MGRGSLAQGWIEYDVPPPSLKMGENRIEATPRGDLAEAPVLTDLELRIRYPDGRVRTCVSFWSEPVTANGFHEPRLFARKANVPFLSGSTSCAMKSSPYEVAQQPERGPIRDRQAEGHLARQV